MDDATRKHSAKAWPLFKAVAEGRGLEYRGLDGAPPTDWVALEPVNGALRLDCDHYEYREVLDLRAMIGELVGDTMRRAFKAGHASDLPEIHRECMAKLKQLFEEQGNRENE